MPNWMGQVSNEELNSKLDRQGRTLHMIDERIRKMSAEFDRLTKEVGETKDAADKAVALIQSLAQQIRDNVGDPAALTALADSLDASQKEINEAVDAAGTPAPVTQPTDGSASTTAPDNTVGSSVDTSSEPSSGSFTL